MPGWLTVLLLGLVALAIASWRDRSTRLAAERALSTAPTRPGLDDLPSPTYVPQPESRTTALDEDRRRELEEWSTDAVEVTANLADPRLRTMDEGVDLAEAWLLAVTDPVGSAREVLPACQAAARTGRPLVVACTAVDEATVSMLAANLAAGTLRAVALVADADEIRHLAELAGARPVGRVDLQAGVPVAQVLGQVGRLVVLDGRCLVEA